MKNFKTLSLLVACIFFDVFVSAQSADEIIAKYIQAIGGREKLSKISSLYTESKAEVMGMESTQKVTILNGKGYKQEMELGGSVMTNCYTDSGGWSINPWMGSGSAETMPEEQYSAGKNQIFIGGILVNYTDMLYKVELLGNENVGSVNAAKVKLTAPDSTSSVYFFDPDTGYLIKSVQQGEMQGQVVENVLTYSDYKQVDGYTLPHTVTMNMGGMFEMTNNITKVEVNKPVDPAIFIKP